jgi:hypothetical protein
MPLAVEGGMTLFKALGMGCLSAAVFTPNLPADIQ